jgi:two-component system LytT family response regulator
MLRVLVVDDEPLARGRLRRLLRHESDVEVIGECGDGPSAVTAILESAPDLVLLDVQMPGMDGFAVLGACDAEPLPEVIFVTAHDEYALRAFERHALDYVLKPVGAKRLAEALAHARRRLAAARQGSRAGRLRRAVGTREQLPVARLLIRERDRAFFLRVATISHVTADGNHVVAHVGEQAHRVRMTLNELTAQLDPARFRRISRSCVVNLDAVREIQPWFHGDAVIVLVSGEQVRLSRTYRAGFYGA